MAKFCGKCGTPLKDEDRFCFVCGSTIQPSVVTPMPSAPFVAQPIINGVQGQPEIIDIKEEPIEIVDVTMVQPFVAQSFAPTYSVEKPKVKNYAKTFGIVTLLITMLFVIIVGIPLFSMNSAKAVKDGYVIMGNDKVPTYSVVGVDLKNYGISTKTTDEKTTVTIKYLTKDLEDIAGSKSFELLALFDKFGTKNGENFLLKESINYGKVLVFYTVTTGTDDKYTMYTYEKINGSLDDYSGYDL